MFVVNIPNVSSFATASVVVSSTTFVPYSITVNHLPCGTTFQFQAWGTARMTPDSLGEIMTFSTLPCTFTVTTNPGSATHRAATFNGTVQPPGGGSASAWFQWRNAAESPSYVPTHATPPQTVSGLAVTFAHTISGLPCSATFAFQAVASANGTTVYGRERIVQTNYCARVQDDFNGDGEVDLVLRDPNSGENTL